MLPEWSAPDDVDSGSGDQQVLRPSATGATSQAVAEASSEPGEGGAPFPTPSLRKQLVMDLHFWPDRTTHTSWKLPWFPVTAFLGLPASKSCLLMKPQIIS